MLLFVYGSLRGGHPIMGDAEQVDIGKAFDFTLFDLGSFPAMIPKEKGCVVGEIWNVEAGQMEMVDQFEGTGYYRQRIPVFVKGRKKPVYCWAYIFRYRPSGFNVETFPDWHRYCKG